MSDGGRERGPRGERVLIAAFVLFLAAIVAHARVGGARGAVLDTASGQPRLLGVDSYYHLRQTEVATRELGRVIRWDERTDFPHGEVSHAAGLFDVASGLVARVVVGRDASTDEIARVAAWIPVALASLTLLAVFAAAALASNARTGMFAAALLYLFPGEFLDRTLLGAFDHHAAEAFLTACTLLALVAVGRADTRSRVLVGLAPWPLVLFAFTWFGAPLHFVAVVVGVVAGAVVADDPRAFAGRALRFGAALLSLCAIVRFLFPSWSFTPRTSVGMNVACAATAVLPLMLSRLVRTGPASAGRARAVRFAVALVAGVAATWVALEALPASRALFASKLEGVAEHARVEPFAQLFAAHAVAGYVALAAMVVWTVHGLARGAADVAPVVVSGYGLVLFALWGTSGDYGYVLAPVVAVVAALALHRTEERIASPVGRIALTAAVLAPLVPGLGYTPVFRANPAEVERRVLVDDAWRDVAAWLDAHPPVGNEGVLCAWDFGNVVTAFSDWPVVRSQAPARAVAAWWSTQDEDEALATLDDWCGSEARIRYVVVDARTAGDFFLGKAGIAGRAADEFRVTEPRAEGTAMVPTYGPAFRRSIVARLYLDAGAGLRRMRLVHESAARSYSTYRAWGDPGRRSFARESRTVTPAEETALALRLSDEPFRTEDGFFYDGAILPSVRVFEVLGPDDGR